ncbi:MAG: phosphotransferase [Actinomycetota bacterium]
MRRPSDNRPSDAAITQFLRDHHGGEAVDLEPLSGGFWSAAWGYRVGSDELVLRLNDGPDGFRADEQAMAYRSPGVPVPDVLHIGEGLGRWFAVSRRHHGRVLEQVGPEQAEALGPTVANLLAALRTVPDPAGDPGPETDSDTATDGRAMAWASWLLEGLTDRPGQPTSGWRARLEAEPAADRTFRAAETRVRSLLDACPDRRQLVHGDLLHANVLVTPLADAVTAVFSWKCSTWGDAVYDLAWCTFWGPWHPGIAALDLWSRVPDTLAPADRVDLASRHHAYELQIGASHLGWYATVEDPDNLGRAAARLDEILERGPLAAPGVAGR